jgi:hypothetical protein
VRILSLTHTLWFGLQVRYAIMDGYGIELNVTLNFRCGVSIPVSVWNHSQRWNVQADSHQLPIVLCRKHFMLREHKMRQHIQQTSNKCRFIFERHRIQTSTLRPSILSYFVIFLSLSRQMIGYSLNEDMTVSFNIVCSPNYLLKLF